MMRLGLIGLGVVVWQFAAAQAMRDPMQAPFMRASGPEAPHDTQEPRSADAGPRWEGPVSVMRIDGQPRLVVGTRLMGVGQMLGAERIERISETEVWLRQGPQQRKLALFEGVQRSPHGPHQPAVESPLNSPGGMPK